MLAFVERQSSTRCRSWHSANVGGSSFSSSRRITFSGTGFARCRFCARMVASGRLKINDLNPRFVISKQVNPALAHLPRDVGGVEGKALAGAKMFAALFARGLDDFALIVGCLDVQRLANGVQRDHRSCWPVPGEPGVFACAGKSRHERDRAAIILMRRVVQAAELIAVKQESRVVVGEGVREHESIRAPPPAVSRDADSPPGGSSLSRGVRACRRARRDRAAGCSRATKAK